MAKSLRSKRRRKMRAEKRIVNAKKELVKLREVAARLHGTSTGSQTITKETLEANLADALVSDQVSPMSVDVAPGTLEASGGGGQRTRAMRINNQWMNQKKIKAIKSKISKHNKRKARRGGSASLGSRRTKKSLKKK